MKDTIHSFFGPELSGMHIVAMVLVRLLLAAVLGGAIGLEREFRHKPAGLRTNMFICFGSAMFTVLSGALAGSFGGDHTRIAAQIIPGIGFIGAGSILHSRGSVTGLTTAATLFVVASIGMAAGGGLYLAAIFATLLILLALHFLGWFERSWNLKPLLMDYVLTGSNAETMIGDVNNVLNQEHHLMRSVQVGRSEGGYCVQFTVEGTLGEHHQLTERFRKLGSASKVEAVPAAETE